MIKLVHAYLLQHKIISIPGLGTVYVERIPAQSDFVNRQLLPPAYHYRFDRYFDVPNKDFFTFVAARKNVQDYEAIRDYNDWARSLRNQLDLDHAAVLNGIGRLTRDESGDVAFEPDGPISTFDIPVPAQRIIRTNSSHHMLVGDRETTNVEMTGYLNDEVHREKESWWVYALILAAAALVCIFFHYYKNGRTAPFGNQQIIQPK